MTTVNDINNDIKTILKTLAIEMLVETLTLLFDKLVMNPRQIAKKITATNSGLSDKELNLMYYGQDLQQVYPNYKPYETETEDMVKYDGKYKPVDIKGYIRQQINDLKEEVRSALISLQNTLNNLAESVTKTTALLVSAAASIPLFLSQTVPNPTAAGSVGLLCHNAVSAIKMIVFLILPILPKFSKLSLLIGEKNLPTILNPLHSFLQTLNVISETIVGFDIALLALDVVLLASGTVIPPAIKI